MLISLRRFLYESYEALDAREERCTSSMFGSIQPNCEDRTKSRKSVNTKVEDSLETIFQIEIVCVYNSELRREMVGEELNI